MSDLSSLFPHLAGQLENWDGKSGQDDGSGDPSHGGVTDTQIEDYLRQMGALRAPLSPAISGQEVPAAPQFVNNGRAVPPGGQATVEPPQQTAPEPPATGGEAEGEGAAGEEVSPEPPPPQPVEDEFYNIGGRRYDRAQAEAWAQFDSLVGSDAELRDMIAGHLRKRAGATGAATAQPATPLAPAATPLPALPPEYADDPVITALYQRAKEQQETLDKVARQSQYAAETATSHVQRTYSDIAQGVISEFKQKHELDEKTMAAVTRAAHSTGYAEKYMSGVDPLTGAPVKPDPYEAVRVALQAGYLLSPETRYIERDREAQKIVSRTREDAERKEKLGGISGAAGSVPRTQPVPTNPKDARAAMEEEVRQMFSGSWVGDGS